jgi:hypothetical protein
MLSYSFAPRTRNKSTKEVRKIENYKNRKKDFRMEERTKER